jgi:serralysin
MAAAQAVSATTFIQSLGINMHIDLGGAYNDLQTVESAISYLGIDNVRDSPASPNDLSTWLQVTQATGVKFDAYVGQIVPSEMPAELGYIEQLAQEGILNFIEGADEEDDSNAAARGNNLQIAEQFQQGLYGIGQSLGLPVINLSFGAGWTAANNWIGDYASLGDLSGIADYANAHIYPAGTPDVTIQQLNADAHLAAASRQVIASELGYNTSAVDQTQIAKWILDAALDGTKDGDVKTYFYALLDDQSGSFGLMNADGSPRPAGEALHNLTTLVHDSGGAFGAGTLNYTLDNTISGDNSLLIEKSDGSYWLAIWNESNGGHTVTLNLASAASDVEVFDALTGTAAVQSFGSTSSAQIWVPDHPVLVEIVPSGSQPTTTPATPSTPASGQSPPPSASSSDGMTIAAPSSVQATAVPNVSISDPYALANPDNVSVTLTDQGGTITTVDAWGNTQLGSGGLSLSGTIWQVNAALANLEVSGGNSLQIAASDDAGNQASASVGLPVITTAPAPTSTPAPTTNTVQIAAGDTDPVVTSSSTAITASAGDHMIFIQTSGDTLVATGGTESVQAYQGGNAITAGDGNDTIRFAGAGNTIDAGGGNNHLEDSGSNNTIVLPDAGQGYDDIYGWVMQNGDTFDLRPALAQAGWSGDGSTLGSYVQVAMSGNDATISIAGSAVATLNDAAGTNLANFLTHAIT